MKSFTRLYMVLASISFLAVSILPSEKNAARCEKYGVVEKAKKSEEHEKKLAKLREKYAAKMAKMQAASPEAYEALKALRRQRQAEYRARQTDKKLADQVNGTAPQKPVEQVKKSVGTKRARDERVENLMPIASVKKPAELDLLAYFGIKPSIIPGLEGGDEDAK